MNAETLKALKGSIRKWKRIEEGKGVDRGPDNCPLCKLFFYQCDCKGCPVFEKTGLPNCSGTPYDEWADAVYPYPRPKNEPKHPRATTPKLVAIAREEREFLESLLP